jgi:tetraacyldisaccharide 4'-kinase
LISFIASHFVRILFTPVYFLLSRVYYAGLCIDRSRKKRQTVTLPRPVLSIGNLVLGGTGKTPLLIKLLHDLKRLGYVPAILTRGYRGIGRVSKENDEAKLIREKFPDVLLGVGADREESAQKILTSSAPDVFVLDDGFQHWHLHRQMDIVCLDATNPWGGEHLFPWGQLREPLTGLNRAQMAILTRTELIDPEERDWIKTKTQQLLPKGAPVLISHFHVRLLRNDGVEVDARGTLAGKKILAVSGVGNPAAFEKSVTGLGARVIAKRFSDHYDYTQADVDELERLAGKQSGLIVTTEKDWVKLKGFSWQTTTTLLVLAVDLIFDAESQKVWDDALLAVLNNVQKN